MIRRSDIDINELIKKIYKDSLNERLALFIWGVFLYALSFSLFLNPYNIVTGGTVGLSLIINKFFRIDNSLFVFIFSLTLLIIGFFTLGKDFTIKTIIGVIILPVFLKFTSIFPEFIQMQTSSLFIIVFFGGLIMGLGNGIIIRSGFCVGGFQTLYKIINKYTGISIGKATLITNGILVVISGIVFGYTSALYAVIGLYVASVTTDRIMLETSISKTFFIITKKPNEINDYIIDILGHSATIVNAKGGYKNENRKMLMCVMPTRQYFQAKEIIRKIDNEAFFLITDTYEINGGV